VAEHYHAHAAALGHIHHLLLRRTTQDRHTVLGRSETHHRVERLDVDLAVGADHRELADRDARQLLHHPAIIVGQRRVDG
jgi:hypothetical protein